MYHFIYKTTHISGKYYVGRHSTKNIDDGYFGSGKWVRSIKDKSQLKKEILKFCTKDELLKEEEKIISQHIGNYNCMNYNNSSVGFSSGKFNPSNDPIRKKKMSENFSGENNPSKREDVRKKISQSQKGKKRSNWSMSDEGKKNISNGRKGIKYSEEGRKKISDVRKKDFLSGKREHMPSFKNQKHSKETIKLMKEKANKRPKYECVYCFKQMDLGNLTRFHNEKCKHKK